MEQKRSSKKNSFTRPFLILEKNLHLPRIHTACLLNFVKVTLWRPACFLLMLLIRIIETHNFTNQAAIVTFMKIPFIFCFLFLLTTAGFSQTKGKAVGTVLSATGEALEKATVTVIAPKDSAVISYLLTDAKGSFEFVRLPAETDLILIVSHINASAYSQHFTIHNSVHNFGQLKLAAKSLDEVVVNVLPPVRMNKDTLEYNTNFFKTRPNANVEELIKQLPGLQVNMDGTIYYQGKEVSKVKVNDKDFFSSDVRIATRNLDASLIKTVQVFRDKGESKINVEDEEKLPIIINLKVKKEFLKASFGKVYGSGGTRERYEAGALFNTFRDTLQLSFLAFGNNINRQSFDYSELSEQGGLNRAEQYGFDSFGGRNYSGKANDIGAGVNLNNDWGKKTKLNIMYIFKHNNSENANESNQVARYDTIEQFSSSRYQQQKKQFTHNLKSLFRHRIDTTAYFEFTPSIKVNRERQYAHSLSSVTTKQDSINRSAADGDSKETQFSYSHGFYFEKQLSKEHSFSFRNNIDYSNNSSDGISDQNSTIYNSPNPETKLWVSQGEGSKSNAINSTATYVNKSIEKLNFSVFFAFNTSNRSQTESIYFDRDNNGKVHGSNLENSFDYNFREYISSIKFYWKPIKDIFVDIGTAYAVKNDHFDLKKLEENRNFKNGYWLPNVTFRYKNLSLLWQKNLQSPSPNGVQTVESNLNPLYTRLQSFIFDNVETQNINFSFYTYTSKIQLHLGANINYENKSIGSRSWRDLKTGQYTVQSYLADSKYNSSVYNYFRYSFRAGENWSFYLSQNSSVYNYENYESINDVDNKTNTLGMNFTQEFSVTWKNLIGIQPKYTYSRNKNMNSVKDNPDFIETTYSTHRIGAGINIYPIKGFSLETSYALDNRASGLSGRRNYHILNASVYYTMKNNSQLKLTGFDILNQNTQNYWGSQGNATYFGNSMTLKQYFMLGYIYKFNRIKTK